MFDSWRSASAVLVLTGCLGLACMPAAAQAPAATKGGMPDIVGFTLGIPLQEAYAKMKAYDRIAKVDIGQMMAPEFGNKPTAFALALAENGASSAEIIEADVTLPPGKQAVWRIMRKVLFTPGQQPLIKNLLADLRKNTAANRT